MVCCKSRTMMVKAIMLVKSKKRQLGVSFILHLRLKQSRVGFCSLKGERPHRSPWRFVMSLLTVCSATHSDNMGPFPVQPIAVGVPCGPPSTYPHRAGLCWGIQWKPSACGVFALLRFSTSRIPSLAFLRGFHLSYDGIRTYCLF